MMNKKQYAVLIALMIVVGSVSGTVSNRLIGGAATYAQEEDPPPPPRPQRTPQASTTRSRKWEYCSLTKAAYPGSNRGGLYWISYFRDAGVQVLEVEEQATERGGPSKAIAKLGEEGWEMVGQGPLEIRQGGLNAIYFKRPKP
jgi:hypothetical protein